MSTRSIAPRAVFCLVSIFSFVSLAFVTGGATPPVSPQPTFNFYFGNLHSHTSYSDGSGTPREAYRFARDQGDLDFLALTEHNHDRAEPREGDRADRIQIGDADTPHLYPDLIQEADRATEDGQFVALYGQEFSSIGRGNHTNAFMANKVIRTENGDYRRVFTDQWMQEHGVQVIQLNHPWEGKRRSNSRRFLSLSDLGTEEDGNYGFDQFPSLTAFRRALDGRAFLIEVINGPALQPADEEHGEIVFGDVEPNWYIAYLNMGLHLAPTGDQDNHYRTWGTINENRTVILARELTRSALLEGMKERRVYASEDKDLKVTFTVNGHIMGSRRPPVPGAGVARVRVTVSDADEPDSRYRIQLFYDNRPGGLPARSVLTSTIQNNGTATFNHSPNNRRGYYFVVVTGLQGANKDFRAWTAPVWFE